MPILHQLDLIKRLILEFVVILIFVIIGLPAKTLPQDVRTYWNSTYNM